MVFVDGSEYASLTQTDAVATHGQSVACSGAVLTGDTGNARAIEEFGARGQTPFSVVIAAGATEACIFFESNAFGYAVWPAGLWHARLFVVSGETDLEFEAIYVCRVNSAGVNQATVASKVGTRPVLAGTNSITFRQVADEAASLTDRVYIVLVITNNGGAPSNLSILPNQFFVSPVVKVKHVVTPSAGVTASVNHPTIVVDPLVVSPPSAGVTAYGPPQLDIRGGIFFPVDP